MKFRVKAKHMSSYKLWEPRDGPKQIKVESGVAPEAVAVEEAQPEQDDGNEERGEEDNSRLGGSSPNKKEIHKEPRVKLELRLNHGDVVVMKGREIQRIWEVSTFCPALAIVQLQSY